MKILISIISYFCMFSLVKAQDKNISFITTSGTSLRSVTIQANYIVQRNRMKIIGVRNIKEGNNWTRIITVTPKY